jgi:alkanesulfonate monooxygenase SsuD/methylene tetrahydromethanopterin reductase-like flavin-dependent oxidoreductase (luciferase family)
VCGSPDEVVQQIGEMAELCGMTDYLAWTRIGGLAHSKVTRSMELMGSKVIPQLREMGVVAG